MMKKIECIIRSEKLKDLTEGLLGVGIGGMTVSEVRGFGVQSIRPESFLFVHKTKIEIYALDSQVNEILAVILKECFSGKAGDGKVAVIPLDNCIRIRTKEKMDKAIV